LATLNSIRAVPGDTLYDLAKKYKTTVAELKRLNPQLVRANGQYTLFSNSKVNLPSAAPAATSKPPTPAGATPPPAPPAGPGPAPAPGGGSPLESFRQAEAAALSPAYVPPPAPVITAPTPTVIVPPDAPTIPTPTSSIPTQFPGSVGTSTVTAKTSMSPDELLAYQNTVAENELTYGNQQSDVLRQAREAQALADTSRREGQRTSYYGEQNALGELGQRGIAFGPGLNAAARRAAAVQGQKASAAADLALQNKQNALTRMLSDYSTDYQRKQNAAAAGAVKTNALVNKLTGGTK